MSSDHIIKSYDSELSKLQNTLITMGGLAEVQLASSIQAVVRRDSDLATEVIEGDHRADQLERDVEALVLRLLALRQPMARDLREIISALKIASDLERICDYAANIAKRSIVLNQGPAVKPALALPNMAKLAQLLIKNVLDAYVQRDGDKAMQVWLGDEELDALYTSLFRELLLSMMEDPRSITAGTHLLFMAKNIERIGDHATHLAETIYFLMHGTPLKEIRPKRDRSSSSGVLPGPNGIVPAESESSKP
jgi:phosphate transport system protein